MKLSKRVLRKMEVELEYNYNPYIEHSTKYFVGYTPMYLYYGKSYTKEELVESYIETAMKDIKNGFNERRVGYYDKWYRYNRLDECRAYDFGVKEATKYEKCEENMRIIEVMEVMV